MRKLIFLLFLMAIWTRPAHAAGGSCPQGVPTGITKCYYIDFASGSDTNAGTDESTPLKHSVGMKGCTANCSSMSLGGGVGVIFKGGVTWDYTIWPWQPYKSGSGGGDKYGGCSGAGCLYYGVDKNWYAGASWSRPIFSGGGWSNPGTNTICNRSGGTFLDLSYSKYIIIDNFEFTEMCSNTGSNGKVYYIQNANGSGGGNFTVQNSYFHGARFPASAVPAHGDYWAAIGTFDGTLHFTYNVVDGSDSGPTPTFSTLAGKYTGEAIYASTATVDHNVMYNITQALDIIPISINNNYMYNASATSLESDVHSHIANDNGCNNQVTIYNNVVDTVVSGQGWQPGGGPCTYFFFNSIWSNSIMSQNGGRMLNVGPTSSTFHFFNNTMECGQDNAPATGGCGHFNQATFHVYNSHFVGGAVDCGQNVAPCGSWTTSAGTLTNASFGSIPGNPTDILTQTQSTANAAKYVYNAIFQFAPSSNSSSTVGKGINLMSLCNQINDPDALAACKSDTTYAVSYDQVNHRAIPSGRAIVARPSSGSWDIGAYQYGSSSSNAPTVQPPADLSATVN
ncbi:MAG TPA: hypothetical protein VMT51_10095 [Dongiaceae bacterium]|nr:hypothetical protein [Dongiaceae bacterium]